MYENEKKEIVELVGQSTAQTNSVNPFAIQPVQQSFVPFGEIASMGVTPQQAQKINEMYILANLELQKKQASLLLQYDYAVAMKSLGQNMATLNGDNVSILTPSVDFSAQVEEFVATFKPVKVRKVLNLVYLIRDDEKNRHVISSENDILTTFFDCLNANQRFDDSPTITKAVERAGKTLKSKIPFFQNSSLTILSSEDLVLANGIYSFTDNSFKTATADIFNTYAIPYNYNASARNPDVFDAMLNDMTAGNELLKRLIYEVIGAILSNIPTLKKIFVFQGVSNGGKTRLMNIIADLLDEFDVKMVNTVSEITTEQFRKNIDAYHLVCINDSADKKVASVQASYLKSFADGSSSRNVLSNATKILIATNHALTSGENGYLEPALENRFLVVPFAKAMDNQDEVFDYESSYFEYEREGIIKKSLEAFSAVVASGRRFSCNPQVNAVIQVEKTLLDYATAERDKVREIVLNGVSAVDLGTKLKVKKILLDMFEITTDINYSINTNAIVEDLLKIDAGLTITNNLLGKILKETFGEQLKDKRQNGGVKCYNLTYKKLKTAE